MYTIGGTPPLFLGPCRFQRHSHAVWASGTHLQVRTWSSGRRRGPLLIVAAGNEGRDQDVGLQTHACTPPLRERQQAASGEVSELPQRSRSFQRSRSRVTRRKMVQVAGSIMLASVMPASSQASRLPAALDRAWTTIGGGPADLVFPEEFLGTWDVASTLVKVDLPFGPEFVPDLRVVDRAKREDLNNVLKYSVSFIRNKRGEVITDRRFNTASLLEVYMGRDAAGPDAVAWSPDEPNILTMSLPGGAEVLTQVTRRSLDQVGRDRLNTSEFFRQVFQVPRQVQPRIKASQCFTKYKWRNLEAAELDGGPAIVATQVVSDFLTPDDGEQLMMRAGDKPVVTYTYTMAFFKHEPPTPSSA